MTGQVPAAGVWPVFDVHVVGHAGNHALAGAGMAALVSFHSACRFFSCCRWDADRLGLATARLIVDRLLDADPGIAVVVDDTLFLFRRWGKKFHHAVCAHAAQGPVQLGRGNRRAISEIVIGLPFCGHPVYLPVLFRPWAGNGTPPRRWSWPAPCSPCSLKRSAAASTNTHPGQAQRHEARHRVHARVEGFIRCGKDTGLARWPPHSFAINTAWVTAVAIAIDLLCWMCLLLDGPLGLSAGYWKSRPTCTVGRSVIPTAGSMMCSTLSMSSTLSPIRRFFWWRGIE